MEGFARAATGFTNPMTGRTCLVAGRDHPMRCFAGKNAGFSGLVRNYFIPKRGKRTQPHVVSNWAIVSCAFLKFFDLF
jgi:hypothetical protein